MQQEIKASQLADGDRVRLVGQDGELRDTVYRVIGRPARRKGLIVATLAREDDDGSPASDVPFAPDELVTTQPFDRVPVYDLPTTNEYGQVDYIVPGDQWVMNGERVYGEPGDHIHGIRDVAGIDLSVYDGADCKVCNAPLSQTQARRWAKAISAKGVVIAVACTRASARGQFESGDPEWGIMVNGKWYGTKADFQANA